MQQYSPDHTIYSDSFESNLHAIKISIQELDTMYQHYYQLYLDYPKSHLLLHEKKALIADISLVMCECDISAAMLYESDYQLNTKNKNQDLKAFQKRLNSIAHFLGHFKQILDPRSCELSCESLEEIYGYIKTRRQFSMEDTELWDIPSSIKSKFDVDEALILIGTICIFLLATVVNNARHLTPI